MSTPFSESRASRPVLTSAAGQSPLAARTCRTRCTMSGSSSTSRMRGPTALAMRCCLGPKANPTELLPPGFAPPRVPQPAQPPIQRELPVAQIFEHGIQQEDQDFAPAAEGKQMALEPVSQAVAKTPGAHQNGKNVDQYPVAERRKQKCQEVRGAEQLQAGHPLHHEEEQ